MTHVVGTPCPKHYFFQFAGENLLVFESLKDTSKNSSSVAFSPIAQQEIMISHKCCHKVFERLKVNFGEGVSLKHLTDHCYAAFFALSLFLLLLFCLYHHSISSY